MASNEFKLEIEALIEQKRGEIEALEATLRMVSDQKTMGYIQKPTTGLVLSDRDEVDNQYTIDLNSLGVEPSQHGPTLAERIKGVLKMIPENEEFTVPHVEAMLKQTGFSLAGKSPRARLAMIMNQLEREGLVIRTAKPKGFKPHRFKLAEKDDKHLGLEK